MTAMRNPEVRSSISNWIPAVHSTGVEPCGNDDPANSSVLFYNYLYRLSLWMVKAVV